jgi:phosphate transport system permease protein
LAITIETVRAGEPERPARPLDASPARRHRRVRLDRWATRLVVLGGVIIIASILAILLVIAVEVYPLFKAPRAERLASRSLAGVVPAPGEAAGVDEYREVAFVLAADGGLHLASLGSEQAWRPPVPVPDLANARLTAITSYERSRHVLGTSDGRLIELEMKFDVDFGPGQRVVKPAPAFGSPSRIDEGGRPVRALAAAAPPGGLRVVAQVGPRDLVVQAVVERKALIGAPRREATLRALPLDMDGEITAVRMDGRGEDLFLGTSRGQVIRVDLRDPTAPARAETVNAGASGARVTMLGLLLGDRRLVVGDADGNVTSWQVISPLEGGTPRLTRIHEFTPHAGPVTAFAASLRDKGFITADGAGVIQLHYGTSGRTLLALDGAGDVSALVFAPKADGVLAADRAGRLTHWRLDNPHPEITLATLFGRVWYEGYAGPAHVWQSTGGTDDFEAKFSLTPLIYGTLKGTIYALLFAVPLALLAAGYVSEFMHATLKAYIKPVVEIMAALPSVVLGFLAGLWLAPMVERIVPGLFLLPPVLMVAILTTLVVWRLISAPARGRLRPGIEVFLLVPVVIVGAWVAFALGDLVEARLLAGDYRGWLLAALGLTYDQRNSLVVGVAMGFAVIPIIFTIAEDSLSNVPQHLRAGSLALGATRWQTALRIVLPTASPGIFSAIMIGFGRAVGETMIVLMATGNTPVMDWSIFSGFRAMSANIAVELPEAPEGGTLFRVLFLAAFLLFCLTFAINTAAELVRLRLRRRYRYL